VTRKRKKRKSKTRRKNGGKRVRKRNASWATCQIADLLTAPLVLDRVM
jgi:hypothetical protein